MIKETELEKKIRAVADSFKREEHLLALSPKFGRALLNSPFASYGCLRKIAELQDESSPFSQFVGEFLRENLPVRIKQN